MFIPVDILDIIISFIDDTRLLANLALTSSLLLHCSRPRSFRSIVITADNVSELVNLLTSPYQTVSDSIQEILLSDGIVECSGKRLLERQDLLMPIASTIGRTVTSMTLDDTNLVSLHPHVYQPFLSKFSNLRSITLSDIAFASVSQVMCMLGSFKLLQTALLNDIGWGSPSSDTPDIIFQYDVPSSLRKLCLWGCYKRDVMECFLSQNSLPIIPEIDLGVIASSDTEAVGRYIGSLGKDLIVLSLAFSSLDAGGDAEDFYLNCDLSLNTHLKFIHFDRLLDLSEMRLTNPWPWIAKIISSLRSTELETICFSVYVHSLDELSDFPFCWSEMDQFFDQELVRLLPHFQHLQFRISFDFTEPDVLHEVSSKIRRDLPLCDKDGFLQFIRMDVQK